MKREERNLLNQLRKTVTNSTIVVEIPERFTHEARQAMHELLTIEKHMIATCIGWNDIREEYCIRYIPQTGRTNSQEGVDADSLLKLPRTDYTWNGYKKPEPTTTTETEGETKLMETTTTTTTTATAANTARDVSTLARILSTVCGSRTPNETAAKLLDSFGSFKNVMEARPEALATVVTKATAAKLAAILPAARALIAAESEEPEMIGNVRELEAYCKALVMGERAEKFYVIAVNSRCRVVGVRCIATGSLSEVAAYPRLVMETALNYNAHSVFLCHNHPGGTCAPSSEDISSTLQLQRMLRAVGIPILDHMIVAGGSTYSMAQHCDVEFR